MNPEAPSSRHQTDQLGCLHHQESLVVGVEHSIKSEVRLTGSELGYRSRFEWKRNLKLTTTAKINKALSTHDNAIHDYYCYVWIPLSPRMVCEYAGPRQLDLLRGFRDPDNYSCALIARNGNPIKDGDCGTCRDDNYQLSAEVHATTTSRAAYESL